MKHLGNIIRVSGKEGRLVVAGVSGAIDVIPAGTKLEIGFSENYTQKFIVDEALLSKNLFIIKFHDIDSDDFAFQFIEQGVFVNKKTYLKLLNRDYDPDDIIGCTVVDSNTNNSIGEISDIWFIFPNDIWVVSNENSETPIPAIPQFINKINIKKKIVEINLIDGLINLNKK